MQIILRFAHKKHFFARLWPMVMVIIIIFYHRENWIELNRNWTQLNWTKLKLNECASRITRKMQFRTVLNSAQTQDRGNEKLYQFQIDWRKIFHQRKGAGEWERNHTMWAFHSFGSSLVIFSTIKYNEKENWTILYLIECSLCVRVSVCIFIRDGEK